MKEGHLAKRAKTFEGLKCPTCGNGERFIEIMEHESHLVDGNLNYLHLVDAITDHYECCNCGERIEAIDFWNSE